MKQYFFRNFLILLLLTFSFFSARAIHAFADYYTSDDKSITIVIDPGHGGPDPGKISPSGILEKDINLQISSTLKTLLKNRGYNVIMTRYDDNDLSSENSKHTKVDDLAKRVSIMSQDDVSLVVSIHQNSYTQESVKGPQVFYYKDSAKGKKLAASIQEALLPPNCLKNHTHISQEALANGQADNILRLALLFLYFHLQLQDQKLPVYLQQAFFLLLNPYNKTPVVL